jgi:hypothetical protein
MHSIRIYLAVIISLAASLITQNLYAQVNVPSLLVDYPDTIVHNAKIITIDDQGYNSNPGTIAQAMAVRDGKILKIGNNNEILALKGPETKITTTIHRVPWKILPVRCSSYQVP